jgi:lipopolysaccharide/colanic/teichoic acid biosynthesis glycosyltransferase
MYRSRGKRILDILLAAMGLIISLPFFVVLPVVLRVHFNGNPFFLQLRPGLNGRLFAIIKFKTMHPDGRPLSWLGRILRKSSLDELPQFWNVLRGNMSIVGPRPLLAEYLPMYNAEQHLRHSVKPGITGLAQINGRNRLDWNQKFEYDLRYVEKLSFSLDLHIIRATAIKVLTFGNSDGDAIETIPFKGSDAC